MGKEIDFRSDIYSLAVVAYSLTCGQLPFTGKASELFEYHESGSPPPPASIQAIPHDVSDAILAGLARRDLMTGLRSAGRALAIRHFALATFALADAVKSIGFLWHGESTEQSKVVVSAFWFPVFALFAAAPLFLYDWTAANERGPLLQLDRTPEVRITARALSISSMVWLAAGLIALVYEPIKSWLFGGR